MPIFEVQTPDGRTFEVDAPDLETAAQSAQEFAGGGQAPIAPDDVVDERGVPGGIVSRAPAPSRAEALQEHAGTIPGAGIARSVANAATPEGRRNAGRALQIGTQATGRGLADFIGLPGDLANAIFDLPLQAADLTAEQFGGNVDFRFGPSPVGGDAIASGASEVMRAVGVDPIAREEMLPDERAAYNINRFGTEAATGGGALARTAMKRFTPGMLRKPAFGDSFLRPYTDDAAKTFRGDVGAGAGAGAGLSVSQENDLGPVGDLVAMVMGGVGGGAVAHTPETIARTGRNIHERLVPDPEILVDQNRLPTSRRVSRRASEIAQTMAEDPALAAETITRRMAAAEGGPVATTGLLSGDTGLVAAEQGVRVKAPEQFRKSDAAVARHASDLVSGLTDPAADTLAAQRGAQARPGELADVRDAEALPLLREAEAAGVTVDPRPVVDLIEQKLSTAKRPAVRTALTEARGMINQVGSDELDTSVSGLYEARKAINDIIEGRTDSPTGRYAKSELIEVRTALDEAITTAEPRFGKYLEKYREGSAPINELTDSKQVARLMAEKPQDVANSLLGGSKYASPDKMREITQAIGGNPEAARGWRAAVAEVLSDKVRNTGGDLAREGTEGPVSIAKLRRTFGQHEEALSGVFSAEDMGVLRRAHEALSPLENRRAQATVGSQTAENAALTGAWDALGTALTFRYGAIHAGMMMHRAKRAMRLAPGLKNLSLDNQALELVNRAWFDPDLAKHLLEADVAEFTGPRWHKKLQALLVGGELARDGDEPDDVIGAIMRDDRPSLDEDTERAIMGR